jgi:hypothetical protein
MECSEEEEVFKVEDSEYKYCVFGVWGASFVLTILLMEFTVFLFVKYYQSNFNFTIPVSTLLVCCIVTTITLVAIFYNFAIDGPF